MEIGLHDAAEPQPGRPDPGRFAIVIRHEPSAGTVVAVTGELDLLERSGTEDCARSTPAGKRATHRDRSDPCHIHELPPEFTRCWTPATARGLRIPGSHLR